MKAQKLMLAALLAGFLLAAFAMPVDAQTSKKNTLAIVCQTGPSQIKPLQAPGQWDCTATLTVGTGVSDPVNFATVTLSQLGAPSWATVVISPAAVSYVWTPPNTASIVQNFKVAISLTQDAPAFQTAQVTITGTGTAGTQVENLEILPTQLSVTPDYFNLYNVRTDAKIQKAGPQTAVTYPITIDNLSNGPTRFIFTVVATPEQPLPAGFQAVSPEPVVVESRATGGKLTSQTVSFQVYTPYRNGYVNDIGAIQLKVESAYAPDPSKRGADSSVSTLTQSRGFYVPGFEGLFAIVGIAGAAVAVSRMGRKQ